MNSTPEPGRGAVCGHSSISHCRSLKELEPGKQVSLDAAEDIGVVNVIAEYSSRQSYRLRWDAGRAWGMEGRIPSGP